MRKLFVEIGVADFNTCLPLLENGWRGFFVEPVPRYAQWLREQTADKDATVIEAAISDHDGMTPFLIAKEAGLWIDGASHVDSDEHIGTKVLHLPRNDNFIESRVDVHCMTLDTLLMRFGITHVDLMKIDTEGHEMNILMDYSWKVKPTSLKIEHCHVDDEKLIEILESQGYFCQREEWDIYAWH